MILGLDVHPRLSRRAVPVPVQFPVAQNNGQDANEDDHLSDSDSDEDYVLVDEDEDDDE